MTTKIKNLQITDTLVDKDGAPIGTGAPPTVPTVPTVVVKALADGSQSIGDGYFGFIYYQNELVDTHNAFDSVSTFTAPVAGWYQITASVYDTSLSVTANQIYYMRPLVNGVNQPYWVYGRHPTTYATQDFLMRGTGLYYLDVNHTLGVGLSVNTNGATIDVSTNSEIQIVLIAV